MNDATTLSGSKKIVVEETFPHPAEKVWRALTEREFIDRWMPMHPTGFAAIEGSRFTFQTTPGGEWDGVIHCEVLTVDPPKTLAYAWRGGHPSNVGYGAPLDTIVTFTLENLGDRTRVRMVHSGFALPRNETAFSGMRKGWPTVVRNLGEVSSGTA